jgi:predicted hydrolase (HD superfamily)
LDLNNLPTNIDKIMLKKLAGVKHIVSSEYKSDNLTGLCQGQGRIKLRLSEGVDVDQVKKNFKRAGVSAKVHTEDVRKKLVAPRELQGLRTSGAQRRWK